MCTEKKSTDNENWSEDEKAILHKERFIAEIVKIRKGDSTKPEKKWWKWVLESKVLAVLITVLIGGIFGNIINNSIQKNIKDREFELGILKSLSTTKMELQKDFLQKQIEEVNSALRLVGKTIQHTEALAETRTEPWGEHNAKNAEQLKKLNDTIDDIENAFKVAEQEWKTNQHLHGFLLKFYFYGDPEVSKAWDDLCLKIKEFVVWASVYDKPKSYSYKIIDQKKQEITPILLKLNQALFKARIEGFIKWFNEMKKFSKEIRSDSS